MASGFPVVQIVGVVPPASSGATLDTITGGATPAEAVPIWAFADAAAAYMDFYAFLKGYGGGGLTLRLCWAASVNTNNAVWQAAIRRLEDDAENITSAFTYDFNTVTAAAPSAIGEVSYDNIGFTNGADMDSWADGEMAIIRIFRDPAHGSDNLGGTARLLGFVGYEA